ncbi:DNA-binding transcriptional LysR family regulator [Sphingomonas jejuensis]|uniref:DNA-binding transcriptional LysR family regulator n=1 Tax=Sphingomonas jejuensis TaxID=904715 RepID=A0ABX0XP83_9SPHN|nr:LysR family transcriptional regulator [Sphingomonas jejuensis]NJC35202.1 DNA-binding transcriptional LysR family regulator [Sphingomonas jejuensis]
MELRQLRQFVAVADAMSFRKAAAMLNMAQPPLSVSVRKLEEELGVRLFDRNTRAVALTDAGQALLPTARAIVEQAASLKAAAGQMAAGSAGLIRLGFIGSAVRDLLPRIIGDYRAERPGVELKLEESTTQAILDAVEGGGLDAGLVRTPLPHARTVRLHRLEEDRLCLAMPAGWTGTEDGLAAAAERPFILYPEWSALHMATLNACQEAGFLPRVVQTAAQIETIFSLVSGEIGVALVPERLAPFAWPGVTIRALAQSPAIGVGLVVRDGSSPLVADFTARVTRLFSAPA